MTAPSQGKGRKRTGTQSLETNPSKKEAPQCPVYDMSGHSLEKCWYIFDELKPQEVKLTNQHIKKIKKKIKDNE